MRREDLEKLLGGYAAGTLTDEERRALFQAAVSDQELFEKLAEEEPLRDALADQQVRARVRAAIEKPRRFGVWALAVAVAAAAVVIGVVVMRRPAAPPQVAMVRTEAPAPPAAVPAPAKTAPSGRGSVAEPAVRSAKRSPKTKKFEPPKQAVIAENRIPPPPAPPPPAAAPAAADALTNANDAARIAAPPPPPPRMVLVQAGSAPGARDLFYRVNMPPVRQAATTGFAAREEAAAKADKPALANLGLRCTLLRRALEVEANTRGYLYVLAGGVSIFQGPVDARKPTTIAAPRGPISIVLARQPVPDSRQQAAASTLRTEMRDGVFYAVNTDPTPEASVLLEVQLTDK